MLIPNLQGITRVSPTLVVAPSWVLGLAPAPSLIGQFAEHPVLCRRAIPDVISLHPALLSWLKSGWVESERDS
ncbi:hypothetical protein B0H13DRAFT_2341132 [Mycena leptocephala]|nr:hypothetical protein B0H13DRAFT_2341132 [Mycena leptocephala]